LYYFFNIPGILSLQHPFLKYTSINSRVTKGVFKKCGKQEEDE
jgi:hypothetical protein